jgi:hypothetical protein
MPPQRVNIKAQNKGRLLLALQAFQLKQVASISEAARLYNIPHQTLSDRIHGHVARVDSRANSHKITPVEEEILVQWIISMYERGYPLATGGLRNATRLLLRERVGPSATIGINWPSRFI